MSRLPIYDRLRERYEREKYRDYNISVECAKINSVLKQDDPEVGLAIGKIIYAIIHHHDSLNDSGLAFRNVSYGGVLLSKKGGITYVPNKLPPFLLQIIILFVNELIDGTCPESAPAQLILS